MDTAIRVLFYLALLGSVGVYAWRAYRHYVHHETRKDREAARRAAHEAQGLGGPATPTPGGEPETDLVRQVIRDELASRGQESADVDAAAPTPSGSLFGLDQAQPGPPVSELVTGIAMPCDLAPMVTGDELDPQHVTFVTTGHAPSDVGAALAGELERLGFTMRPVKEDELLATPPGDAPTAALRVRLHPDASAPDSDGVRRFPHAPTDSVVVELISERRRSPT